MRHGSQLPGITTFRSPKRMALDEVQLSTMVLGDPIQIASGVVDAGHTGQTNVLRPGGMFAKKTGSSLYVPVSDAYWGLIDKGGVGEITSEEAPDDDWEGKTLSLYRNGVLVAAVVLAGTDDTTSEVVTALNANASFRNHALASGGDGEPLVITDVLGFGGALSASIPLTTAFAAAYDQDGAGGNDASVAHAKSTQPDVRVIGEEVCMVDAAGNAIDGFSAWNFRVGYFQAKQLIIGGTQAAQLSDVPAWARAVMEALGSRFAA